MNKLPKEQQVYESKALIKYCRETLTYNDLIGKTDIVIQSFDEDISDSYLAYMDTILTKGILNSELKLLSNSSVENLVRIDRNNISPKEMMRKYSLKGEYLILISPIDAFNYYDIEKYNYYEGGSRRPLKPFICKNIEYADSIKYGILASSKYESTRIKTRINVIGCLDKKINLDIELINNEFYTTYFKQGMFTLSTPILVSHEPNIKRIIDTFPEDFINNILFLKHDSIHRNQILNLVEGTIPEINVLVDLAEHLDLEVIEKKYDFIISNGEYKTRIDKRENFKNADYYTRRDIYRIFMKPFYAPDFYDEGYEIPEDKKRPIILSMEKREAKPRPVEPPTQW